MTNKIISPSDLMPADSLGDIFSSIRLRYDYSGIQLIHSEVHNGILKCLAFDKLSNVPSYLEIDTLALNSWDPLMFSRSLELEASDETSKLNYYSMFDDVDFRADNLNENESLKFHLFGKKSKELRDNPYSKTVSSVDKVIYDYPGYQFQRVVSTYKTHKFENITTTSIKSFLN